MKELKVVALLLGTMLTKDELDEFMAEADSVSIWMLLLFQLHNVAWKTKRGNKITFALSC